MWPLRLRRAVALPLLFLQSAARLDDLLHAVCSVCTWLRTVISAAQPQPHATGAIPRLAGAAPDSCYPRSRWVARSAADGPRAALLWKAAVVGVDGTARSGAAATVQVAASAISSTAASRASLLEAFRHPHGHAQRVLQRHLAPVVPGSRSVLKHVAAVGRLLPPSVPGTDWSMMRCCCPL